MKGWPGEPDMEHDVLVAQGPAAAADGKPISNVIFDFGNVLIYWDPSVVLLPRYSQETIDQFLDNDISGFYDANDRMDGGASPDEGVAWMREHYGDKWADILRYYLDNFEDSLTGVVPGARVLVNDLKAAGIGVWGLSNWEKELFPIALKHCEILQRLDGRLVSGYVHMRKPHKDIYEKALEEFGISAESSVFIDDKAMNIAGANEAGIRGIRFSDARKLRELLIEQGIDAREIECAVLCPKAGSEPQASWPGEIVLDKRNSGDDQFYDFDSKYMDSSASHVEVPANLPQETLQQVRETAVKAFKAVDGAGLSRVDTFVTPDGEVMVNEINTMPGFTPISMYPKAWEATGIGYTDLITKLIDGVLR